METFQKYSEIVKTEKPIKDVDNNIKLKFYSLFKQTTVGNINTSRPGMFDISGKAKWDAWKSRENMEKEEAMSEYITLVKEYYTV